MGTVYTVGVLNLHGNYLFLQVSLLLFLVMEEVTPNNTTKVRLTVDFFTC